jgi:hypothetical protein
VEVSEGVAVARATPTGPHAERGTAAAAVLARAVRREAVLWRAALLVLRRRRDVPPGSVAIEYSAQLRPRFRVFALLLPFEIVVVHLVVPWETARTVLLVLGVLSALWFLGLLATLRAYPHTVDREELRLRWASFHDHRVPTCSIGSVRRVRRTWGGWSTGAVVDGTLVLDVDGETDVLVGLVEPVPLDLGRHGRTTVTAVALWADDPAAAVAAIRTAADPGATATS